MLARARARACVCVCGFGAKVDVVGMAKELAAASAAWAYGGSGGTSLGGLGGVPADHGELVGLLAKDSEDHFRFFDVLDHYLVQPELLQDQALCRVPEPFAQWMVKASFAQ